MVRVGWVCRQALSAALVFAGRLQLTDDDWIKKCTKKNNKKTQLPYSPAENSSILNSEKQKEKNKRKRKKNTGRTKKNKKNYDRRTQNEHKIYDPDGNLNRRNGG